LSHPSQHGAIGWGQSGTRGVAYNVSGPNQFYCDGILTGWTAVVWTDPCARCIVSTPYQAILLEPACALLSPRFPFQLSLYTDEN